MKSISLIVSLCCPMIMAVLHAEVGLPQGQFERQSNIAFYGGSWFNGLSFKPLTVYSVRGLFAFEKPDHIDQTVNLKGSWIVPPFGEAHNHNLGTGATDQERKAVQKYLADGVSEEYAVRKDNPAYSGQKGLDPQLLPKIVEKARGSNLRVPTHVTNARDFHNAVAAGVDEITHIPFLDPALISLEDARLAAKQGITVITTVGLIQSLPHSILPEASVPGALKAQAENLRLLRDSDVTLAIGSDNVADSSAAEFGHLSNLGLFDNLRLLNMWTQVTPNAFFPNRLIGAIREGYEASFLALEGNPLENLDHTQHIKFRFKQGTLLSDVK